MKKEIAKGAILGLLVPIVFIAILYLVFQLFEKSITDQVISSGILFALAINALLMRFFFKKNKDYTARGIMMSSFICFIYIVLKFVIVD